VKEHNAPKYPNNENARTDWFGTSLIGPRPFSLTHSSIEVYRRKADKNDDCYHTSYMNNNYCNCVL